MRWIAIFLLLCLVGCIPKNSQVSNYKGIVTVTKVNGEVALVEMRFPEYNYRQTDNSPWVLQVRERNDLDKVITNVEAMIVELKEAREQMKVVEPPIESFMKPVEKPVK